MVKTKTYKDGLTAQQIADFVGIDVSNVRRKRGIDGFMYKSVDNGCGAGRHLNLYSFDALTLWGHSTMTTTNITSTSLVKRSERSDKSKPRSISEDTWNIGVQKIKESYINHSQANLKLICELICNDLKIDGYADADAIKFYKAIKRSERSRDIKGIFFSDIEGNWEDIRLRNMKRNQSDLSEAVPRYDYFAILESAGLAGDGFGAARIIVIDDFKRDAWIDKDGKAVMTKGLAFIDGLTRYPLLYMPCDEITTEAVARGILLVAFRYGLYNNTVWVIENSSAMKNANVENLIASLYTDEELLNFKEQKWITQLFGCQPSPIVHNVPHVPRFAGKALIERQFQQVKDEFDAVYFPKQFQGGSRQEAVTLTRAAMPYFNLTNVTNLPLELQLTKYDDYWYMLWSWLYDSFIDRPRLSVFGKVARRNNFAPTIREAYNYYNHSHDRKLPQLDVERYANIIYFAQPNRTSQKNLITVKNRHRLTCTIDGNNVNIVSDAITSNLISHKVAVMPCNLPGYENQYLVMRADNRNNPEFIGIFKNYVAENLAEAEEYRKEARKIRETANNQLDEVIKKSSSKVQPVAIDTPHKIADGNGWINQLSDETDSSGNDKNTYSKQLIESTNNIEETKPIITIKSSYSKLRELRANVQAQLKEI